MTKSRTLAAEFAAQAVLALMVGLGVSVVLAGAALLLAGGAPADPASARAAMTERATSA